MRQILMIIILAAMIWLYLGDDSVNTSSADSATGGDCIVSIREQYSGQWAEMSVLERAMVGLSAASCGEVQP